MSTTNRRKFIATAAAAAVTATAAATPLMTTQSKYPLIHHVFFWLKNPDSKEDLEALIAGVKTLAKIETVRELRVGVVAHTAKRDVVDQTWAVSEHMLFSDLEGQATYQTHPIHLEFIKNCSHLWQKVEVYDAMDV